MEAQMKVLALDAMGVSYKAKDDVTGVSLLASAKSLPPINNSLIHVFSSRLKN
jgi:hypothetical protein